jgi:uncharacterized protein (UPF0332 family)
MTDKEALFLYRLKQAEETLSDAEKMLDGNFSPRSITNRAYYSMFYGILALFLNTDVAIKTSRHVGVISIFDKEFIQTGKIDKHYSSLIHKMFNIRQKGDYKEFAEVTKEESREHVELAKEFLEAIKNYVGKIEVK